MLLLACILSCSNKRILIDWLIAADYDIQYIFIRRMTFYINLYSPRKGSDIKTQQYKHIITASPILISPTKVAFTAHKLNWHEQIDPITWSANWSCAQSSSPYIDLGLLCTDWLQTQRTMSDRFLRCERSNWFACVQNARSVQFRQCERCVTTSANRKVTDNVMGLLQLRYEHDSSTIRLRFDYDSSAIQHPTRSYVLSSNNEHVNSFPLL